MAAMAAEKIEMTILKSEEECLTGLQLLIREPGFRPANRPEVLSRRTE
jgi:hypothetical protein